MSEMMELMEKLRREAKEGGELVDLPCPFCQMPRSQRSDYIRCQPCGVNWLAGEMHLKYKGKPYLECDPRVVRKANVLTVNPTRHSATQSEEVADAPVL